MQLSSSHVSSKVNSKIYTNHNNPMNLYKCNTSFLSPSSQYNTIFLSLNKMERNQLSLIFTLLLLSLALSSTSAFEQVPTKAGEKKVDVVVEGVVYCQSCDNFGSWSLTGAKPISAAKVSVICNNYKNQVSYYKAFETNAEGYFYAQLSGLKIRNNLLDHPLQSCHVKLVSSPLESCNILTNVNDGLNGAPLHYENKRLVGKNYEAVIYAAGPLAFRPANCSPSGKP